MGKRLTGNPNYTPRRGTWLPGFDEGGGEGTGAGGGASGAGGGTGGQGGGSGAGTGTPPAGDGPRFTQADLDRIAGQTRAEAERAASKKLLESLGMADVDSAKKVIAAQRAAEDAQKTEAQRAADAAVERERKAAVAEAAANERTRRADVLLACGAAGVRPDRVKAATAIALGSLAPDAKVDDAAVKAILEADAPELLEQSNGHPGPSSDPARRPAPGGTQAPTGVAAGRAMSVAARKARLGPAAGADAPNPLASFSTPIAGR